MNKNKKSILKVKKLSIQFGGLKAVDNFNIDIKEGELIGLIGPNGAGKTTLFNLITGVYHPTVGNITLCGQDVTNMNTHKRVLTGIARTFQNIRLFSSMTVLENVMVANNINMHYGLWDTVFHTKKYKQEEKETREKAMRILKIFDLEEYKDDLATSLAYGKQRKLEIARAMMTDAKLLCLDEPAAGMNPSETEELMKTISFIRKEFGITILLIEHDMKLVMGICDWITVINFGKTIACGKPDEIRNNHAVIVAYLGDD